MTVFDMSDAVAMLKYLKDAKGPLDREYIRTLDMNGFDVVPDDHTMNSVAESRHYLNSKGDLIVESKLEY
ncbi:hypothetical protein BPAE_0086g00320 [Botrytis paeoniae]|uniref:Uncharacterized protein n=1 Tax=Botrytis paeoniae TaxID=278948 RepID=A0A4Z1FTV5_9HELO|nr:hypothetical protein BPAE_0086g00320 [Botrytis paeoniae]